MASDSRDSREGESHRSGHSHSDAGRRQSGGHREHRRGSRRERSRRGRSARRHRQNPLGFLLQGPLGELLDLLLVLPRRFPVFTLLLLGLGLWRVLPALQNSGRGPSALFVRGAPEVITVFVEDPQRSVTAVKLWKDRPGSMLVLQGSSASQAINRQALQDRGVTTDGPGRVVVLTQGCDTFGQLTTLARFLSRQPKPGRLTVVTSPAHLERSVAIATIVLGSGGWRVEGVPANTEDNRPESHWRLWRDQVRAQIWRLTGWDGTTDGSACRTRERGL